MSANKDDCPDRPACVWHAIGSWLTRFVRERMPGWEGTGDAADPSTREIGDRGESIGRWYLEKRGYQILETNWWSPGRRGELDIVAFRDNTLIAVEVKSYPAGELTPAESLSSDKRSKLVRLLKQYAKHKRRFDCNLRVDLLIVEWAEKNKVGSIKHIESAATGDDL